MREKIEKLEHVEEGVFMNKSESRKQGVESNHEARRKKRMIVFNLKTKKEKNDREQVVEIIENMGVRVIKEIIDVEKQKR